MIPGPGVAHFSVSLGSKQALSTVGADGDVGGEVRLRLSNVRRLANNTWEAGLVEYIGLSPAKAPEQNVSLGSGALSYATTCSTETMATWAACASLKVTYTPNNAPSSTTLSGLPSGALVGARLSVVAAATDPDSNLASLQVCWKTPSGVVQTLMDWTNAFSGDTASASKDCVLPAFTQTGTYTVFVNARDKLGATRLPLSAGLTEELHTVLVSVVPGDLGENGVGSSYEAAIRADANRSLDSNGDGIINAVQPHLGSGLGAWSTKDLPSEWALLKAQKTWNDRWGRRVEVGVSSGEMSVDKNGALSYTLPLRAVPGTAGMEPKLSLVYSSQSGPGVAGFGWSLSGLSSITRGPQTLAVDGRVVGVSGSSTDRFYLDGQRLMAIGGKPDGGHLTEYRTENESFSRIVSYCAAYVPPAGSAPKGVSNKFDQHTVYTDLNGDGLPDLLTYVDNDRTFKGVALNTGVVGTTTSSAWRELVVGSPEFNKYLPPHSLARYHDSTMGENTLDVYACELRDVNGDGLVDLLYGDKFHIEPADLGEVYLNTGDGWLRDNGYDFPLMMGDKGANEGVAVIDINCDGLPDIVRREGSGGSADRMEVQYGIPGGFAAKLTQAAIPLPLDKTIGTGSKPAGTDFVDLNGDGAVDMVQACQGQRRAYLNKASPHFALTKVTTGLGVSASVVYQRLNEADCYVRGTGAVYPVRDVTGPLYVVSELRNEDGAGGLYSQNYLNGAMRSNAKYGSLGFEWVSIQDGRTRIRNTTVYSQDFPTIGMPLESFTTTQAGALLASSTTQYARRDYNDGLTRLVYASSTELFSYYFPNTERVDKIEILNVVLGRVWGFPHN